MKAAVVSEKGFRPEMEDAHFLDSDFAGKGWVYIGIYDGHGGQEAAKYASERLHQLFLEAVLAGKTPQEAFISGYETTSAELNATDSGTTAVDLLLKEGKIYSANVGDARAIVVSRQGVHQLTTDHRLENEEERQRIQKMGGLIRYPYTYRDNYGLMPTRTIGDPFFKPVGIIATPSVSEYQVSSDDFLVLAACDGLFDFMENEEVARFAREFKEPAPLLQALKKEVLINRLGTDNLTMIAISLLG